MADSDKPFASWLNATMHARGLSQAAMARQVGVADTQVSRWRRGAVTPSVRYLRRIASTFEVPGATLEQMAGYAISEVSEGEEPGDIDPEREAEIQALQARLRHVMEQKLPRSLWSTYGEACESLAVELATSLEHVLQEAHGKTDRRIGFHRNDE